MTTKFLSCADTAKLIRLALRESFPGVKFSVRSDSYSGGASIDVKWTDGPTAKQVEAVADSFEGSYFDGMIDYKGSRYHYLDDERVHFGASFIHCNRHDSDAQVQAAINALAIKYAADFTHHNIPVPSVEDYNQGRLFNVHLFGGSGNCDRGDTLSCLIRQDLSKRTRIANAMPSATLARVKFAGDDGYGAGTVGPNGDGQDTGRGYPNLDRKPAPEPALEPGHILLSKVALALMPAGGRA